MSFRTHHKIVSFNLNSELISFIHQKCQESALSDVHALTRSDSERMLQSMACSIASFDVCRPDLLPNSTNYTNMLPTSYVPPRTPPNDETPTVVL